MEWPEGFDERARNLIEMVLVSPSSIGYLVDLAQKLDPSERPTATEIKSHVYFETVDFNALWTIPAPVISTGLVAPSGPSGGVRVDSDVWDVFDDESEGEMELDRPMADSAIRAVDGSPKQANEEYFARQDLQAPRPRWLDDMEIKGNVEGRKSRGSAGSAATDSSGAARVALDGLLKNIGGNNSPAGSQNSHPTSANISRPGSTSSTKQW